MPINITAKDCNLASVDKCGHIRKYPEEKMMYYSYYNVLCMLKGYVDICEIVYGYPKLVILDQEDKEYSDKLWNIIEEAEKAEMKMLKVSTAKGEILHESYVAFIKHEMQIHALFFKYLSEVMVDKHDKVLFHYIAGVLFKFKPEDIRGFYLRTYILYEPPAKLEREFQSLIDPGDAYVSTDITYKARYNYLKKKDKFKQFDKYYDKIVEEATALMKKEMNSAEFKKFAKEHAKDIFLFKAKDIKS